MLTDERPFMLGGQVSTADLAAYSTFWVLLEQSGENALAQLPHEGLRAWAARVAASGLGTPIAMGATEALETARRSVPETPSIAADGDPSDLKAGTGAEVRADDTGRDPVRGTLVFVDAQEIVIRSEHSRMGDVDTHFPRAGFDVMKQ